MLPPGLGNRNTGDAAGDLFFRLGDEMWLPSLCRSQPSYFRCKGQAWGDFMLHDNVFEAFDIETDGKYTSYAECNPPLANMSSPVFECTANMCGDCPRALAAVGSFNLSDIQWGPAALPHPYDMWKFNTNVLLGGEPFRLESRQSAP